MTAQASGTIVLIEIYTTLNSTSSRAQVTVLHGANFHHCPLRGNDPELVKLLLDPAMLDQATARAELFKGMVTSPTVVASTSGGKGLQMWAGETAAASGGGKRGVTNTFESTIWFLDELGQLARACPPAGCAALRQTLTGANCSYCMIDENFAPNPDYHAALLWKRLAGPSVLRANGADRLLRSYAHCHADGGPNITIILVNLRNQSVNVNLGRN